MKFFLCCASLLALILISESAKKVNVKSKVKRTLELLKTGKRQSWLGGKKPDIGQLLSMTPEEGIQEKAVATPNPRVKLTRYEETFKGIAVFDTIVTASSDQLTGDLTEEMTGEIYQEIDADLSDVIPNITEDEAFEIAIKNEGHDAIPNLDIRNKNARLMVKMDANDVAHLVYYLSYVAEGSQLTKLVSRPMYIIDAKSGVIMEQWEGIDTTKHIVKGEGGNKKIGRQYYDGSKYNKLDVTIKNGQCTMENDDVEVFHMMSKETTPSSAFVFSCSLGAQDEARDAFSQVNDAMFFGSQVIKMYEEWVGARPMNTTKLKMRVHYGVDYANAFWDGNYVTFGQGDQYLYPFASLDITAHEVSHAYTEAYSDLLYKYQSGAMNEAFSDMAGEAAKYYIRGSNDWTVGYDIMRIAGISMRYMNAPQNDGYSINHASQYTDSIDVHYTSGVYNKAFYNLAQSRGWNTKKAFQVFALANRVYWKHRSTFDDGACGVQRAAKDLGFSSEDVKDAFRGVGVVCNN